MCSRRTPPPASRSTWPARTTSAAAGFSKTADGPYAYPNLWQRLCEEDSAHTLKATVLMTIIQGSQGVLLGDVNNETIGHANLKNRSERTESLKRK